MALNTTQMGNDLDYIISDLSSTVTIGGEDYTCTKFMIRKDKLYEQYGYTDEYDFSIVINNDDLDSIPEVKTRVTYNSTEYIILGVELDSVDQKLKLHLGSEFAEYK